MYWYMDCSSHLPYLGQPVQSVGCVARMSSMAILRTRSAASPVVLTTMPSATGVLQAQTGPSVASTSVPLIESFMRFPSKRIPTCQKRRPGNPSPGRLKKGRSRGEKIFSPALVRPLQA